MSAIDQKLYNLEHELRLREFTLSISEENDGQWIVIAKSGVKTKIKRSISTELDNEQIIEIVENEFAKLKQP